MLFHSLDYILFLTIVVGAYWALARWKTGRFSLLVLASCRFYMVWNPYYVTLLLGSAVYDWSIARVMDRSENPRVRKAWLFLSISGNLALLGTFKYFNFLATVMSDGLGLLGIDLPPPRLDLLLPVGISFFTFQAMAYTIDVYRRRIPACHNFLKYLAFGTFFPQLVSGPIVKAREFLPQLDAPPNLPPEKAAEGLFLILLGLAKKVAIADYLGVNLVNRVFDNPGAFTSLEILVALYGYTMQIYCDFSGYTDVARGSAMLLGFHLPENFNRPYLAASPAQFWRRWHITLSGWLREYVYYPLGGSHCSKTRTYLNLWLTFFLIGIWHGAGWNFVVYGTIHGLAMVAHRYFYKKSGRTADTVDPRWLHVLKVFGTFHFVVFSRILFRSPTLAGAGALLGRMFQGSTSTAQIPWQVWMLLIGTIVAHFTPQAWVHRAREGFGALPAPVVGVVVAMVAAGLMAVASSDVVPYIYFQF